MSQRTVRLRIRRMCLASFPALLVILGPIGWQPALADPSSPFNITKTDSPDPVASGAQLTYTITVINTGGATVNNCVIADQVNGLGGIGTPPQLVLTSTRGSCSQNAALVTCSGGSMGGGESWTVTIRGVVTAANGTTLNNTASVTGTKSAQNFTSTATATTLVSNGGGSPLPDLTISKTGPSTVAVSNPMTYTLTVNNIGTANATNVRVVDTVPSGLTGISASGTSLFVCSVVGQTVTCNGGAVNFGSNATITINATSPASTGTITNTTVVDPNNTIAEGSELNNSSAIVGTQVTSSPSGPLLTITKNDSPDPVQPGGLLTYTILVTNVSGSRADDVVMVDGTQGLEAASITASQTIVNGTVGPFGGCTVSAPQVRCAIRTLNNGGTMTVTVQGFVVASAGSTIFNTATVTGNIGNQGTSNTASATTTVKPGIDLTVTKADAPDPVCARSWPGGPGVCRGGLTYTFVVGNSGIETASGVVLRDPLPSGLIFDSYDPGTSGFTCAVDGANVVTCTGGTIPPESTKSLTFMLVAPPATGSITNIVTVDPNNAIFEADETNNTFTESTQVITGIDLVIAKTDAPPGCDPIATSGTQTYAITVDNIGTQDASGIRVRDTLPAGTTFLSATSDNGFTCSQAGGVVECVGGAILGTASESYDPPGPATPLGLDDATITIKIFTIPVVTLPGSPMHNEVRVDPLSEIPEANESNNIDIEDTDVVSGGAAICAFNELTISKEQDSPNNPVARNAIVTYSITVGNDATNPAVNVKVRDFLPTGSRYIEATGTNQFLCTQFVGFVDCTGGVIPPAGFATITIRVFAPDPPGTFTNQAIVDPGNAVAEGNEFNNADSVETIVENDGNDPFIDLTIDKTAPAEVTPGASIVYALEVTNDGTLPSDPDNTAFNVKVRDILPAGTTFVSAVDTAPATPGAFTCSEAGGVVDCIGGTVAAGGGTRSITIVVLAPEQNVTLTNQALVDPANEILEGDETDNTDAATTTVQSVINLKIRKTGPAQATQSGTPDYVITVTNDPPAGDPSLGLTAFDVEVHDPLPVGMIPLNVTATSADPTNFACQILQNPVNVVDCIGDLNPGQEVTITISVFITAETGTDLDNEACVDPDNQIVEYDPPVPPGADGETTDNCSTITTGIVDPKPDLFIQKDDEFNVVTPGQDQTYTITVSNVGTAPATSVMIHDTLPADVAFVNAIATNGFTCTEAAGTVDCTNAGGLAVGGFTVVTIQVTVSGTASLPITNTATVDQDPDEPADALANNTDSVTTSVGGQAGIDLVLVDVSDNPDPVPQGDTVTYTILVVNGGTADATGVTVRDEFDSLTGMTLVSATGSEGFSCALAALTVDCVGNLVSGASTTIKIVFQTTALAPASVSSTITVDPDDTITESNEANNDATEVTTISAAICSTCIDLVMSDMLDTPDPVGVGETLTYTITVGNVGDMTTDTTAGDDVLIFFDLFGDFTFVSYTTSAGFTCAPFSSTPGVSLLTDCTGDLGPGEGTIITITVTPNSAGTIDGSATADPGGTIAEFNEVNNGPAAASTTVVVLGDDPEPTTKRRH